MSDLQLFSFQDKEVRVVDIDSTLWFAAVDVFVALDISWRQADSLTNIPEAWKRKHPGNSGSVESVLKDTWLINESAVYKIAFRSNKPEAETFTNYVAEVILPSIRKTGSYISDTIQPDQLNNLLANLLDKVDKLEKDKTELLALRSENNEYKKENEQLNKVYEEYPGLKEAIKFFMDNINDDSNSFTLKEYIATKPKLFLDHGQRIATGQLVSGWTKIATNCKLTRIAGSTYYQDKHSKLIDLAIRFVQGI